MALHWFLPGFLRSLNRDGVHPASSLTLSRLPSMLAKATKAPCNDLWTACAEQFHLNRFPFAQVLATTANQSPSQSWALLTPMAIQPEHRGIYLLGERVLALSESERKNLREELQAWMKEEGLSLWPTPSEHWLLSLNKRTQITSTPYLQMIGRDAMSVMPTGDDALYWQAKLTEWQMILQRSFINQQRQQTQQKLVQGLHLWGESSGQLPHSTKIKAVYTDSDAIARWLKHTATGINVLGIKDARDNRFDEALVIATHGEAAWAHGELEQWQAYWQNLEGLINPSGHHIFYPDNGVCYNSAPSQRWKFWQNTAALPVENK